MSALIPTWVLYVIGGAITLALLILAGLGVVLIALVRSWYRWSR